MLEKIVSLYRKAEMGLVSQLAGVTEMVIWEAGFYDTGYMQTQVNRIQKELNHITQELKMNLEVQEDSTYVKEKRTELIQRREQLLFDLIFFASNSFRNLADCVQMAIGHGFTFMQCIQGLQAYQEGKKEKAFQILENYYQKHGSVEDHFLVNKIFGLLLLEKGQIDQAERFLSYALQFVPNDQESLYALKICFQQKGNTQREEVLNEILSLLE